MSTPREKEVTPTDNDHRDKSCFRGSAWLSLLGAFLIQFSSIGPIQAYGVFQDFYKTELLSSHSNSAISWIGTMALFLELTGGILAGQLYDHGYGREIILLGSVIFLLSFFMVSLVHVNGYYQAFLAQGVGMGLGASFIFTPTITMVSNHFLSRKGLALGILSASGPLGVVIYTVMLNQLIHFGPGFPWSVRAAAFLTAGCMIIGNLLVSVPSTNKDTNPSTLASSMRVFITNPPYIIHLIAGFVAQLGSFFPLFYVQIFALQHGISPKLAFYGVAIMNASGILGRSLPGHAADRWGAIKVWAICTFLSGALTYVLLLSNNSPGLILFCIFYGFFWSAAISVYMPVVAVLTPPGQNMGKSIGFACVPIGISALIGNPIIGAIVGNDEHWWKGATFAAVSLMSAGVLEVISGHLYHRHTAVTN
ncbi:MFS general substrate transporter [Dendrothele bispora CBS 962.96]|uniref:MFS general substrate transporter n=1 Tax=Dendrothele bispora (strain CBS 962.96) TaxID=1314807 RepID=A0A4S8L3U9_DENBC|nr:MFS general substrate transporter [Dendrothele bispora CBS 962.96]